MSAALPVLSRVLLFFFNIYICSCREGRVIFFAARALPRLIFFCIFFSRISAATEGGGVGCAARALPRLQDRDTGGL